MGLIKRQLEKDEARGWSAPETYVCAECIADEFLANVVESHLAHIECSYCGLQGKKPIAAPLEDVLPYIAGAFSQYYAEPAAAGLPRDSGEWVGEELITDTADALESLGLPAEGQLFDDISDSFLNDAWIPAADGSWIGEHEHDRLQFAWEAFVERTKHSCRYFFQGDQEGGFGVGSGYEPKCLLEVIGDYVERFSLWAELPSGRPLYRARSAGRGIVFRDFDDLCPPPSALASAGRMNPPGISYGYFAYEAATAVLEVATSPPSALTLACFSLRKPLLVVDLTMLPPVPSIFDLDRTRERHSLAFLHSFTQAISLPVSKDGREHVEYVPSQIVSEYFAQVLRLRSEEAVGGLLYPSAVDPEHTNVLIFPPRGYGSGWRDLIELRGVENVMLSNWQDCAALANRVEKGVPLGLISSRTR